MELYFDDMLQQISWAAEPMAEMYQVVAETIDGLNQYEVYEGNALMSDVSMLSAGEYNIKGRTRETGTWGTFGNKKKITVL